MYIISCIATYPQSTADINILSLSWYLTSLLVVERQNSNSSQAVILPKVFKFLDLISCSRAKVWTSFSWWKNLTLSKEVVLKFILVWYPYFFIVVHHFLRFIPSSHIPLVLQSVFKLQDFHNWVVLFQIPQLLPRPVPERQAMVIAPYMKFNSHHAFTVTDKKHVYNYLK